MTLADGFYYFFDPRAPETYGIIHRIDGVTWRMGEREPMLDSEWIDGVSFLRVPEPDLPGDAID